MHALMGRRGILAGAAIVLTSGLMAFGTPSARADDGSPRAEAPRRCVWRGAARSPRVRILLSFVVLAVTHGLRGLTVAPWLTRR